MTDKDECPVICMQSPTAEEFWCRHDGSKHSCYCPAGDTASDIIAAAQSISVASLVAIAAWQSRAPENRALLVRELRAQGESGDYAADVLEALGTERT